MLVVRMHLFSTPLKQMIYFLNKQEDKFSLNVVLGKICLFSLSIFYLHESCKWDWTHLLQRFLVVFLSKRKTTCFFCVRFYLVY